MRAGERPAAAPRPIATAAEFYALALALEIEASERYAELADQMDVHNNPDVAALFRKMAEIEAKHAARIRERAGPPPEPARPYRWREPDGPETAAFEALHYLMTPYHALEIAAHNEQRAYEFFRTIAAAAVDPAVRALAQAMAEEERQHVALVRRWLAKYPAPGPDWADDPDPPGMSE